MTDAITPKPKRQRTTKHGPESKTKRKGTPPTERQRETMFGGVRSNPQGQTSEWRKATIKASELAAKMQLEFLTAYADKIDELRSLDKSDEIIALVNANSLKLLNDAIDRAHGKAGSSIDVTSNGESVGPQTIRLIAATGVPDGSAD